MKFKYLFLVSLLFSCSNAFAEGEQAYKPLSGSYSIYGGALGDRTPPKKGDQKIAFDLDKKTAREIFDAIGPDLKGVEACVSDPKDRVRKRGNIQCMRSRDGEYSCTFGFDLSNGKSIVGSIC